MRHPFERLVSTYRHLFTGGGWRLELNPGGYEEVDMAAAGANIFSKTWRQFVTDLLLENGMRIPEARLEQSDFPGSWLKTHWAPFWYTCGVCSDRAPHLIIKAAQTFEYMHLQCGDLKSITRYNPVIYLL